MVGKETRSSCIEKKGNMRNISYSALSRKIQLFDYTAFVYDDGAQVMYSGGEMDMYSLWPFRKADTFSICNMCELPDIKQIMQDNLLAEFKSAHNVQDEGYETMVKKFKNNDGEIAICKENKNITYMLVW